MKNSIIKLLLIFTIVTLLSCSKDTCGYIEKCTPVQPEGYMVNTFNMSTITNVGAIYKTTYNSAAPIGSDWNATSLGASKVVEVIPPRWDISDIGQVFGIALDDSGGIYLGATNLYNIDYSYIPTIYGSTGGSAGIYKTDVVSLATIDLVTTDLFSNTNTVGTAKIPNSGYGLGNLAYDKVNQQLFATNLEDGRIYRIDPVTGIVKSIFDPFNLDGGTSGMVNPGEQLWGIGVLNNNGKVKVYFSRTLSIGINATGTKEIWSIDLDSSGEFATTEVGTTKLFIDSSTQPKLQIPNVPGSQAKVTDIAFSCSGKMLLAERGDPHLSKILEYLPSGTSWIPGSNFYTGDYSIGDNSAGGVDYGDRENGGNFTKDDIVWATANAMNYNNGSGVVLYGVQGMSSSGNSSITSANTATDLFIDYDHVYNTSNKGGHGDVEIFDSSCPCNDSKP
jgi:hypothetical protein